MGDLLGFFPEAEELLGGFLGLSGGFREKEALEWVLRGRGGGS